MSKEYVPPIFIHKLADCEPNCTIGDGTKIWRWTHIREGAQIGSNVSIGQGCYVGSTARIGDGTRIGNGVYVWDGVTIGKNCFISPGVVFTNVKKPKAGRRGKFESSVIEDNVTIGANSTIICPVVVGEGSVVGAGSVLTKSIPPNSLCWGNPAKIQHMAYFSKKDTPQ